jgi:hypothetical protein
LNPIEAGAEGRSIPFEAVSGKVAHAALADPPVLLHSMRKKFNVTRAAERSLAQKGVH